MLSKNDVNQYKNELGMASHVSFFCCAIAQRARGLGSIFIIEVIPLPSREEAEQKLVVVASFFLTTLPYFRGWRVNISPIKPRQKHRS